MNFYMVVVNSTFLFVSFISFHFPIDSFSALGFFHMHSAYDRDNFVIIQEENIIKGKQINFKKYDSSVITHFNSTYDYSSIMHYPAYAFSKNKKKTIVSLVSY